MTKTDAENIIDTIIQLSAVAERILESEDLSADKAFAGIKHFLGHYCDAPEAQTIVLDRQTLSFCKQYIKTSCGAYYTATEFFDIDIEPVSDLADFLDGQGHDSEAGLVWEVVDFVGEIQQWASAQTEPVPELQYTKHQRKNQGDTPLSDEEFLALFEDKGTVQHKARLLLAHLREVADEKGVHTYYGALATQCRGWFKPSERDFASILRNFLSVADLNPSLAANVRETKLGAKVTERARKKLAEIDCSRART